MYRGYVTEAGDIYVAIYAKDEYRLVRRVATSNIETVEAAHRFRRNSRQARDFVARPVILKLAQSRRPYRFSLISRGAAMSSSDAFAAPSR